jgi:hypothetical protein
MVVTSQRREAYHGHLFQLGHPLIHSRSRLGERNEFDENERRKRIRLLLEAIHQWLISPSFAKQASWLQHMSGLLEGAVVLSKEGPAPFYSPIRFEANPDPVIKPNPEYRDLLEKVKSRSANALEVYQFNSPDQFAQRMTEIEGKFQS